MHGTQKAPFDVLVIGAGWAGMNAALLLGRARRSVLLVDGGPPRNEPSESTHGLASRDGADVAGTIRVAREELEQYENVRRVSGQVAHASGERDNFSIELEGGEQHQGRRLLLATGVKDELPDVDGIRELWGKRVLHCQYCHAWEVRDEPLAVIGADPSTAFFAAVLARWSDDVILSRLSSEDWGDDAYQLALKAGVAIERERVVETVEAEDGHGRTGVELRFADGRQLWRRAVFVKTPVSQRSDLPKTLGCELLDDGMVAIDDIGQTTVPGIYAAGDLARRRGLPATIAQVAVAVGAGALAAVTIDNEMSFSDIFS